MTIAGVKPVGYTNDKVMGPGEESNTNIVKGDLASIDLPAGIPLYTDEQVREILIAFANSVSVSEEIGYNWEEEAEIMGCSLVIGDLVVDYDEDVEEAVDNFMKMKE